MEGISYVPHLNYQKHPLTQSYHQKAQKLVGIKKSQFPIQNQFSFLKDYHLYSALFFQHHPDLSDNRALPLHYLKERLQVIHLPYIHS